MLRRFAAQAPRIARTGVRHQFYGRDTGARPGMVSGTAIDNRNRNEHLLGEDPPFWNINTKGYEMQDENIVIDRKAFGIPFHVDDDAALDAAYSHHQTAVEVVDVQRVLIPFWMAATSAGGMFNSEVYLQDPTKLLEHFRWQSVPDYEFSYPFEEHWKFNQICASYDATATFAEDVCAGTHIPSMLISRFELLEELEAMEAPPRFIPFQMSTKSAVSLLEKRLTRIELMQFAEKELRKHHGKFYKSNIRLYSLVAEVMKIRPVFLPIYAMSVITKSNSTPVPFFVCGATGRTTGPVVHMNPTRQYAVQGVAGTAALVAGALTAGPLEAAVGSVVAAYAVTQMETWRRAAGAQALTNKKITALGKRRAQLEQSDTKGYKWTVEDEETMEFSYREELRAKARRRADFEQRVQEEAARDEARATGRKYKSRPRRGRTPGKIDRDPLGYYEMLGFKGQEEKVTQKDIGKAFRAQAQQQHPDMVAPELADIAKEKMQKLVEAYSVLRDAKLRKEYDEGAYSRPGAERS